MAKHSNILAFFIAILLIGAGFLSLGGRNNTQETEIPLVPNILNETLTNDMSEDPSLRDIDENVKNFMERWEINGASLSVMRNDSLVYSKGYGWADKEKGIRMGPGNILRLASVSKLITATGIMKLVDQGRISLDDKVFGEYGILDHPEFTAAIKDSNYFKISVEHLLRHQGGFTTSSGDPMFSTRDIIVNNKLTSPPDSKTLTVTQLRRKLRFTPGEGQAYSNFGYLLLSEIIEKVTGCDYESWMQEYVLKPAGCVDMHIGDNYYSGKYLNEVRYYPQRDDNLVEEYNNSGRMVPKCYGGNDVRSLQGAGAWVASSAELAKFVASIDGRSEVPDIISAESVRRMTEWKDENTYSLGWNDTKPDGEWTRTGTLSGTSALIKCFPDGECWILITNTSTWKGASLPRYTAAMFNKCRENCSSLLPHRDYFYRTEN